MIPILLLIGAQIIQRIDQFGLGYALYRITSDVEKLPFPMAPVGALGTMALAESTEEKQKSWKWRVFSIGGVIGLVGTHVVGVLPLPWVTLFAIDAGAGPAGKLPVIVLPTVGCVLGLVFAIDETRARSKGVPVAAE
jgi:hypothetical protein